MNGAHSKGQNMHIEKSSAITFLYFSWLGVLAEEFWKNNLSEKSRDSVLRYVDEELYKWEREV